MSDPMSPAASPNQLPPKWGVRRVNNLPLYLIGTAAAVFFLIIMLVAMDRANTKHAQESVKASGNAALYANEIAGEHQGGMIAPAPQLALEEGIYPASTHLPPVPTATANMSQSPEMVEAQRIRQMKMQQFEEALRAKTTVQSQAQPRTQQSTEPPKATPASTDPTVAYQHRLAQLRKSALAGQGGGDMGEGMVAMGAMKANTRKGRGASENPAMTSTSSPAKARSTAGSWIPGQLRRSRPTQCRPPSSSRRFSSAGSTPHCRGRSLGR